MTNREKEWKSTAKAQIETNMDSDISNLNDDDSFLPIEEQEKEPLSEEEKKEVRKKLFFLLIVIIVVLLGLFIVLIFNPFGSNEKKEEKEIEEKEEKEEEKSDDEKTITELADGDIAPTNYEILALEKEIINIKYDYYENDTLALYKTGNMDINNLTDKNKLFLLSKTNDFTSLLKNKTTVEEVCSADIIIEQKAIDDILKDRFSTTIVNYETFTYNFYTNNEYQKTIQFVYNGSNAYIGKCYTHTGQITTFTQQQLQSATKDKDKLYIDVKVVFIKSTGVYKDPNFTTLITDQNQVFEQYIKNGNTYRYTYDISNSSYSLLNVSLLK